MGLIKYKVTFFELESWDVDHVAFEGFEERDGGRRVN